MAIAKQDFNRGQVVNPLSTFGDDLQKFGVNLRQQELDRLAAERQANADKRAQEQLDMQKQQYADQQAAKAAGSKYMADLGRTLEAGVVSQADQDKLAALSQRQDISPEERAKQIDALLPKMSDAYQKDAGAQLQLMRGVIAAPTIDARDKVALYGSIADPLEKKLSRAEDTANRLAEIKEQDRLAGIRQQAGFTHSENLAKTANEKEMERARMLMSKETYINNKGELIPGNIYMELKPEEQKEWANTGAKKDLLPPKADKTYGVVNDNGIYRAPKAGEKPTEFVEASVFNKIIDSDEKSTGSALAKTLSDFSSGGLFSRDHKAAATNAANEAGKLLNVGNVPLSKANSIINAAVLAAKDKEGTFNKEVFDLAIQQGILSKGLVNGSSSSSPKTGSSSPTVNNTAATTASLKARRDLLRKEEELSPNEESELAALEARLRKVDIADRRAADKKAVEAALSKKPSKRTAEDLKMLEAEKLKRLSELPFGMDIQ
ncbi:MAG: hypothetical protein EOM36_01380 [Bacteroidia bacterium]|nr:hypothetical protein [Bacteroidia bacterium]